MAKQKTQTGTRKRAKVKKQAKRYSPDQKKKILDFIDQEGRGGQTKAVAKFGVTAATIGSWRKKALGAVKARVAAKSDFDVERRLQQFARHANGCCHQMEDMVQERDSNITFVTNFSCWRA